MSAYAPLMHLFCSVAFWTTQTIGLVSTEPERSKKFLHMDGESCAP